MNLEINMFQQREMRNKKEKKASQRKYIEMLKYQANFKSKHKNLTTKIGERNKKVSFFILILCAVASSGIVVRTQVSS